MNRIAFFLLAIFSVSSNDGLGQTPGNSAAAGLTNAQRFSQVLKARNQLAAQRQATEFTASASSSTAGQLFQIASEYSTGVGPISPAIADFNGDGKLDVAVANYTDNTVSLLLGKGDGTFQQQVSFATGIQPVSVAVEDFDHDGRLDLAVGNFCTDPSCVSSSISILLGNGDGTFRARHDFPAAFIPDSIAVTDLNGDGREDLVIANFSDTVSVMLGNGDGTFQPPVNYPVSTNSGPIGIVVGDFNRDHKPDVATTNFISGLVSVLMGNGDGTLQSQVEYQTGCVGGNVGGAGAAGIASGDFNQDHAADLAIACEAGSVQVILGKGDGSFGTPAGYYTGIFGSTFSVLTGDFDGDGKADLATADPGANTVSILLGNGDGTFKPRRAYGAGFAPQYLAAGDFNADGKEDLVTANLNGFSGNTLTSFTGNTVDVLLNNGDGSFPARRDFDTGVSPFGIAIADFNRDGKADLATANFDGDSISIFLGNGDGSFGPRVDYTTGAPASIVAADLNGDHKPDLIVVNGDNGHGLPKNLISIFLGNGDGTFHSPASYAIGCGTSQNVGIADFNRDGKLDIAVGNVCNNSVAIFLGNGDGTFQLRGSDSTGSALPVGLVVGDLNQDGKADLAILGGNTLTILFGNGDGTFQAPSDVASDNGPIVLGDFNGDHNLDIAVGRTIVSGDTVTNAVDVFLGNGDGTFQPPGNYAVSNGGLLSLGVADLNGDGHADLALTNDVLPGLIVLLGYGDGTFQAPIDYIIGGGNGIGLAIADLNEDGRPDVVVTNSSSDTVSAFLNIATFPVFPLSVSLAGTGTGTVTSTPAGINCGNTCSASFVTGVAVTLAAAASAGSVFAGWSGACSGTASCVATINAATAVTATFSLMPDFSLNASALMPASISPGQSATSNVGIAGVNGFTGAVSVACSVSPSTAQMPRCTISPGSINPGATATLTVTTTAPISAAAATTSNIRLLYAILLPMMGLAFTIGLRSQTRYQKLSTALLRCMTCVVLICQPACGGGSSGGANTGTPPGSYTITVTGMSGSSLKHSATLMLKIQ
ncbi:MAG: hypothetical protein DMG96_37125 [Acidobacteria bacterium]|nr:MAG: hypothetical protein DMG96_37125 [Acidobacteriota bacterium]